MRIWLGKGGNADLENVTNALYNESLSVEDVKRFLLVVTFRQLLFGHAVKKDILKMVWLFGR